MQTHETREATSYRLTFRPVAVPLEETDNVPFEVVRVLEAPAGPVGLQMHVLVRASGLLAEELAGQAGLQPGACRVEKWVETPWKTGEDAWVVIYEDECFGMTDVNQWPVETLGEDD